MRIAIVDDMKLDRTYIQGMVSDYLEQQQIAAELCLFSGGEEFFETYAPGEFSILLLDLYMKGMNGMEIARQVREKGDHCQLIFITSSETYAVQGYEVEATCYLLKPVDRDALERALARCMNKLGSLQRSISIVANRVPVNLPLSSIQWVSSYQNAIIFHADGGEVKSYMTLERVRELLGGDRRFLPCYKGCLVNMDRIISAEEDHFVVENGDHVPIRKRGANQIRQFYIQYLCERAAEQ